MPTEWQGLAIPQLEGFTGFVPPEGTGSYHVALIGEAPGEHEAKYGVPFYEHAPAGSCLTRLLRRAGLERDGFTISNSVWSRPPSNYLEGARYEGEAIQSYLPFRQRLFEIYRPRVLVALGNVALKSLTPYGGKSAGITNVAGYVLDGPWDGTWVIGTYHPSFIMRGQSALSGCVIWAIQRAMDIARNGFTRQPARYIVHPSLDDALEFERGYNPDRHFLSYDIETPESSGLDEEDVEDQIEDISYNINRISFCYSGHDGYAITFPWQEPFISISQRMLGSLGPKRNWNGTNFDDPRLRVANCPPLGRLHDVMNAWHFLQPTLPRSLAFVAPFYGFTGEPWKHLNHAEPERYSCIDSHSLQLIGEGVDEHLRQKGQWNVYERHVVHLGEVLTRMSDNGLPYSAEKASAFGAELQAKWDERYAQLQSRVPECLKPSKQKTGYKKEPKDTAGLVQREFNDLDEQMNIVKVMRWCKLEPFLPTSPLQVRDLIKHFGHKVGTNRKTKKDTSDDDTIKKLIKKCRGSRKQNDLELAELLTLVRECRQLSKVQGTYVKGWKPGKDGRIHATPGYWGKMFRISWRRPNISATIQDKTEQYIAAGFRKCVAASPGRIIVEADWKGIEAVLCGWFAGDEEYMRLARLGVHDYVTWLVLADKGKVPQSDVPDLSWSDDDLKASFKMVKKLFSKDRDDCKHIVHGSNYLGTARYLAELYELREALVKEVQGSYFTRFNKLKQWQNTTLDRASRECKLRNPFGYEMNFYEVFKWDTKYKRWVYGDDAKSCVSFLPRDTAAAMLKEALLRLRPLADEGIMIASAHDAIAGDTVESDLLRVARLLKTEMERPVKELNDLVVGVELKAGVCWHPDSMEVLELSDESPGSHLSTVPDSSSSLLPA